MEPTLLEREDQLAALAAAYDAVRAGTGRLAFIAGEAGAGKTALVGAFAAALPARMVLVGVCDPLETPRPLGPLCDVAPELARRAGRPMPDTASRDDLLAFIVEALGAPGDPPVLVLEDVHWADQATIDLLRYAGRRLERLRALVLATFREDETPVGSPVALLRGDLATAAGVDRLAVPPLSRAGTARLVAGSGLDPDRVHLRTGGNLRPTLGRVSKGPSARRQPAGSRQPERRPDRETRSLGPRAGGGPVTGSVGGPWTLGPLRAPHGPASPAR